MVLSLNYDMTENKIDLTDRTCAGLAKIAQGSKQNFEKEAECLVTYSRIAAYRSHEIYIGRCLLTSKLNY